MAHKTLNNLSKSLRSAVTAWRDARVEQNLRRRRLGSSPAELGCLMARSAHSPEFADVLAMMGPNPRRLMARMDLKIENPGPRQAAILGEIERACKSCPDWRRCTRWLESGVNDEAYLAFCPNVGRWDSLLENQRH